MTKRAIAGVSAAGPLASIVEEVLSAALAAVEPGAAVRRFLQRRGPILQIGPQRAARPTRSYDLRHGRVFLLGIGKAAYPMTRAAWEVVADRVAACLLVTKDGYAGPAWSGCRVRTAGHPVPDERSRAAAQEVRRMLRAAGPADLVLVLLSGGGSALLTLPAPGVSLRDLQALHQALLASGATIHEINAVRKHIDLVKGGGLTRWAAPAQVATLILSDVLDDDLSVIASGPTAADPTTYADAWAVLTRYGLTQTLPAGVHAYLQAGLTGRAPETAKPHDPLFATGTWIIVGNVRQAAEAAVQAAGARGWHSAVLTSQLQGEARHVGQVLAAIVREMAFYQRPWPRPACIIAGGETTVTLGAEVGRGGRNQELALAAVPLLAAAPDVALVAFATDGTDGPTDAAGAVVTGATWSRAQALGLEPSTFLRGHDAYSFFAQVGGLLRSGPTFTNVNDLVLLCSYAPQTQSLRPTGERL